MSRTDKDAPLWVRANDSIEQRTAHHYCGISGECTISFPRQPRHRMISENTELSKSYNFPLCKYKLFKEPYCLLYPSPSRKVRREQYHGPLRADVRVKLQDAAKLYRSGSLDDGFDVPSFQARHSPFSDRYWEL